MEWGDGRPRVGSGCLTGLQADGIGGRGQGCGVEERRASRGITSAEMDLESAKEEEQSAPAPDPPGGLSGASHWGGEPGGRSAWGAVEEGR